MCVYFQQLKLNTMEETTTKKTFFIPMWMGWFVNLIAWGIYLLPFQFAFLSMESPIIPIIIGVLCLLTTYVAYRHKQIDTKPLFGIEYLNPNTLIYASAFDALWMFSFWTDVISIQSIMNF